MLKSTGVVRKLDELGRVVLPIDLRRRMEITERDSMEIFTDGNMIVLKKYAPSCSFCSNAGELTMFRGKNVCSECLAEFANIYASM
ncbi:MAG: AbrB/MazE/SpoVT family DNA-binding domain-containing protein [Clostridia bacterium]|nr:AbrB/MazE/SpoVT family DNA-binding domain-containing protein [Clostridia bacterium]